MRKKNNADAPTLADITSEEDIRHAQVIDEHRHLATPEIQFRIEVLAQKLSMNDALMIETRAALSAAQSAAAALRKDITTLRNIIESR